LRHLTILGSTGSIGKSTLDLVSRFPDRYRVVALAAQRNSRLLEGQIRKYRPKLVSLADEGAAEDLRGRCRDLKVEVLCGKEGAVETARFSEADVVVSAIVGSAGLEPTLAAIQAKKTLALANKEPLVMAGSLFQEQAREMGVTVLPVDSEHSGVFQTLHQRKRNEVRRIILTASGGPLVDLSPEEVRDVKPSQALQHPTWRMGAKISIDSATLMNKGLEVIEAHHLFGIPPEAIDVLIHRQSIVHSMVEFVDGSVMAQMAIPDMRIPLSYALSYPDRPALDLPPLNLEKAGSLTFEAPDHERFPCLSYAYEALRAGGTMPAVLNAANEKAVQAYLQEEIGLAGIARIIRSTMDLHRPARGLVLEEIMEADRWARTKAGELVRKMNQH
jgi:1-deoxy-D-xylulose-5-phosphate reductoisomerase